MPTYRLESNGMIHTPGFVRYLRVAVRTQKRWAFDAVRAGYGLPEPAIKQLLLGPEPKVEGDVILLEVP